MKRSKKIQRKADNRAAGYQKLQATLPADKMRGFTRPGSRSGRKS